MLTIEQARQLKPGDILVDIHERRWKVNGQVRTWKTDPTRIWVPLKHGLYSHDAITEADFDNLGRCQFVTTEGKN